MILEEHLVCIYVYIYLHNNYIILQNIVLNL